MAIFNDEESKKDIFDLIKKFDESSLCQLEITIPPASVQSTVIKMTKLSPDKFGVSSIGVITGNPDGSVEKFEVNSDTPTVSANDKIKTITAPLVGTFYASASPNEPPYVKVGDKVTKGMVICIIEAMKTMNEIESEEAGEITEILVKNGSTVEYGQLLFRLK